MSAPSVVEGLNPEQRAAVEATEGPLLVLAGAGSGKTRVLTHRIAYLIGVCGIAPESILAVTFTNKAAREMRERVQKLLGPEAEGVWLATFHSTCVRMLRRDIGHLGRSRGFVIYDETDALGVVREVMRRQGFDASSKDARRLRWRIDQWKNQGVLPDRAAREARDLEAEQAAEVYAAYQRMLAGANALDFGDLLLLTTELLERFPEVLRHYRERWQYVLVDEYQDTNRVQYRLVNQLAGDHRNLCVVGDPDQCLPPETPIQTPHGPRRIADLREGDLVTGGSGWGRTHSVPVEKVMSRPHRGRLLRIRLASGRVLEATPNHVCFARLDAVEGMHYVYLMRRRDKGWRIGTTSGVRASKDGALLNGVRVRTNQEVADAVWILHAGRDPGAARYWEQLYSVRYGIPTMVFYIRGRRLAVGQEWIDRLFEELDTDAAAEQLLNDLELDPRFPHHRPFALVRAGFQRRYVWFNMFGDARPMVKRPWHEHRVQLVTSDQELRARAEGHFPVRRGRRGTWRIETSRKDYDAAKELAHSICDLDDLELVSRARMTSDEAFHFMPASHLREGMAVPVAEGRQIVEDSVVSVEELDYDGEVFDLSVPDLRNYVASGVVVHNSIYKWRGADIRNILDFERDYPDARTVRLETNYRSTQRILSGAGAVVANNPGRPPKEMRTARGEGEAIRFYEARDERDEAQFVVRRILEGAREEGRSYGDYALFYRTNAQSRPLEEELLKYDLPYTVVGGVRFYDRAEVKDALAYLRLLVNPADDQALRRVANRPARGLGRTTLERAEGAASERGTTLLEGLRSAAERGASGKARAGAAELCALVDELGREAPSLSPADALGRVLDRSGYLKALEREGTPEAEARVENLRELVTSAEEFDPGWASPEDAGRSALELFLDQVALVSDLDRAELGAERISLMTAHSAKGLEFPEVFLCGMEEGVFPHAAASRDEESTEEERRLCYVGMTRAMERLTLTWALERRRYGSRTFGVPSRFLREVPRRLVEELGARRARPAEPGPGERTLDYGFDQSGEGAAGPVAPGVRVRHPLFGPGVVLQVSGEGAGQKLRIRFDRAGVKTVLLRYANLELG